MRARIAPRDDPQPRQHRQGGHRRVRCHQHAGKTPVPAPFRPGIQGMAGRLPAMMRQQQHHRRGRQIQRIPLAHPLAQHGGDIAPVLPLAGRAPGRKGAELHHHQTGQQRRRRPARPPRQRARHQHQMQRHQPQQHPPVHQWPPLADQPGRHRHAGQHHQPQPQHQPAIPPQTRPQRHHSQRRQRHEHQVHQRLGPRHHRLAGNLLYLVAQRHQPGARDPELRQVIHRLPEHHRQPGQPGQRHHRLRRQPSPRQPDIPRPPPGPGQQRHAVQPRQHDDGGVMGVQRSDLDQHQQREIPPPSAVQHSYRQQRPGQPQHRQHGIGARLDADIDHHRRGRHQPRRRHRRKPVREPARQQRRQADAGDIRRDRGQPEVLGRQPHALQRGGEHVEQWRIGLQPPGIAPQIRHCEPRKKRRRRFIVAQLAVEHQADAQGRTGQHRQQNSIGGGNSRVCRHDFGLARRSPLLQAADRPATCRSTSDSSNDAEPARLPGSGARHDS